MPQLKNDRRLSVQVSEEPEQDANETPYEKTPQDTTPQGN